MPRSAVWEDDQRAQLVAKQVGLIEGLDAPNELSMVASAPFANDCAEISAQEQLRPKCVPQSDPVVRQDAEAYPAALITNVTPRECLAGLSLGTYRLFRPQIKPFEAS